MNQIAHLDVEPKYRRLLARYRTLRALVRRQNDALVKYISKDAILKCARRLGLRGPGRIVSLENANEMEILLDYCIYDHRDLAAGKQSRNAVERLKLQSPPPPGSDEMLVLEAALAARYRVLVIEKVIRGVGVEVTDALHRVGMLLVDVGLSESAVPGLRLATRVMAPDGIHMTTGAALPIQDRQAFEDVVDELAAALDGPFAGADSMTVREQARLSAAIIRACLANDASASVQYR